MSGLTLLVIEPSFAVGMVQHYAYAATRVVQLSGSHRRCDPRFFNPRSHPTSRTPDRRSARPFPTLGISSRQQRPNGTTVLVGEFVARRDRDIKLYEVFVDHLVQHPCSLQIIPFLCSG